MKGKVTESRNSDESSKEDKWDVGAVLAMMRFMFYGF